MARRWPPPPSLEGVGCSHPSVAGSSASSETYAEPEDEEVAEAEAASIAAPEDEPLNDEDEQEEEEEEEDDEDEEDNEGTAEAGGAGAGPPGLAAQLSVAVRQAALAGGLAEVSGLLCPAGLPSSQLLPAHFASWSFQLSFVTQMPFFEMRISPKVLAERANVLAFYSVTNQWVYILVLGTSQNVIGL